VNHCCEPSSRTDRKLHLSLSLSRNAFGSLGYTSTQSMKTECGLKDLDTHYMITFKIRSTEPRGATVPESLGPEAELPLLRSKLNKIKRTTRSLTSSRAAYKQQGVAHYLAIAFSSSADFPAAMAQMRTPNTALAVTSATEYPICSYVVATVPARPTFLMMYTNG